VKELSRDENFEVSIVVLNSGQLEQRLGAVGIPVAIEPEAGRGFWPLLSAVRRRLASADLVHSHRYKENVLAALSGRPWVTTQHGLPEPLSGREARRAAVYAAVDRWVKRVGARRVIAVAGDVEEWLVDRIGRDRVVRAWNGIADPTHDLAVEPWRERPLRVGVAARLFPVKAIELAIEAVAACPNLELEILGEGPERERLAKLAEERGVANRIRLIGFDPEPLRRIARWRAMLVTSWHEGNPMSVIEALSLGTPVLSTPLSGVSEMLAGRGGIVVGDRDPSSLACALRSLAGDCEFGSRLSSEGRERFLEAFTAERSAQRVAAVYRSALGD
jgi:glycosyltransferase involved in cell wall biosynthesis